MALKHADLIAKMTLEEKASMCDGLDYWHSQPVDRLGIKSVSLNDGPHGIRKKGDPDAAKKGETDPSQGRSGYLLPHGIGYGLLMGHRPYQKNGRGSRRRVQKRKSFNSFGTWYQH